MKLTNPCVPRLEQKQHLSAPGILMAEKQVIPDGESRLQGGQLFGSVHHRLEYSGAVFSDLRHPVPRKLPMHSHELPFFGLLLQGFYGERYGRERKQFSPMSLMFRPAG